MIVNGKDKGRVERSVDQTEQVSLGACGLVGWCLVEMQDIIVGDIECGSITVVRHISSTVEEDGLVTPVAVKQKLKGTVVSLLIPVST